MFKIFARKRPKFRRSPKDGQLYHPGGDRRNAWITASYNNGPGCGKKMPILSRWTFERGQVPDAGRNAARSKETGRRWQERQGWESGGARAKQVENIYQTKAVKIPRPLTIIFQNTLRCPKMEMRCLLVILGGLRLVMFPIYGGEVAFCNFLYTKT